MLECILCEKQKPIDKFSREHIFPDSLLRNIQDNFLITNEVCKDCNSNSGLFIDSPVIKYWFINQYKFDALKLYGDLKKPEIIPFIFLGEIQNYTFKEYICDKWLGPGNDEVYHFRKPFSKIEFLEEVQGLHPIRKIRKEDEGIAVLLLKTNNLKWHSCLIKSFKKQFKSSKKHIIKGKINIRTDFKYPPKDIIKSLSKLGKFKAQMKITKDTGTRFLSKMAIEIGFKYLDDSFLKSKQANLLKRTYKERNIKEREKLKINSTGIVETKKYFGPEYDGISIENVHTIALLVQGDKLFLYVNFYGKAPATIQITDNKKHWDGKFEKGLVIFIAPFLNKIYEPVKLCETCNPNLCFIDKISNDIKIKMRNLRTNPPPIIK